MAEGDVTALLALTKNLGMQAARERRPPCPHDKKLLSCAKAPPGDRSCFDTKPPPKFRVKFDLGGGGGSFVVQVHTQWAPVFAQRFWQLSKLEWWQDVAFFRNDYVNDTKKFVSQCGLVGSPEVNQAWDEKTSNQTAPALESNTRGRLSFSMGAVSCEEGPGDPCDQYRPACTASDYCAVGFSTQIFVNYGDNSRLDAHGFAPFGEVEGKGMAVVDAQLGERLGRQYGEIQELCPLEGDYCVYHHGKCAGVNETRFESEGNEYLKSDFPGMYKLRIIHAKVL